MSESVEIDGLPWISEVCLECATSNEPNPDCGKNSATGNIFHAHRLEIHHIGKLSDVVQDLVRDLSRALQITSIEISEHVPAEVEPSEDFEGQSSDAQPPEVAEAVWEENGSNLADVLGTLKNLESFTWKDCNNGGMRPVVFWEALWRTAATLKVLDLGFFTHELSKLADKALPTVNFEVLTTLCLNATMAHGDTGVMVDQMLHHMPIIEELTLFLPGCDLEGCRIQDISWKYNFPALKNLTLQTYNSDNAALADFFFRHPLITTLDWDVDADSAFIFPPGSLPNLTSISITSHGYPSSVAETLSVLAAFPVKHLRISNFSHSDYSEVAKLAETLKCLEIYPGSFGWRPESDSESDDDEEATETNDGGAIDKEIETEEEKADDEDGTESTGKDVKDDVAAGDELSKASDMLPLHKIFKDLLERLPELQELALDLDTSRIYVFSGDDEGYTHPDPMTGDDLISALALLPTNGHIRAVRLYDKRGLALSEELLADLPGVPSSLEYIKWDTSMGTAMYRLERQNGLVRGLECEPVRITSKSWSWTEGRALEY